MRCRRGLALIVVTGVLGVLAVLATAFVTMAQLERRAARQRLHASQAFLLARSGLEDALARLEKGQDPAYGGEDWDASGALDGIEGAAERFGQGRLDTASCPLRHALRPSFFVRDPSSLGADGKAAPRRLMLDGFERGHSGALGASHAYAIKVKEGGLFVNGGVPSAPPGQGYNAVLRRILGTLAEALDREDGADDGRPLDQADGERLVELRPAGGWTSYGQIQATALGGSALKIEALRPYLALRAWVDRRVIAPNATAVLEGRDYQTWADIKRDRGIPAFEPRAPVDLAWARRQRPVLIALLSGLKGLTLDETTVTPWSAGDRMGTLRAVEIANTWSSSDDCHLVAEALLAYTGQITTWQEWNAFCNTLLFPGDALDNTYRRDLLKAGFNPNSDLNKFNPNRSLWKTVDKSDLLAYSTEFSLPSLQPRELESLGRVLGRDGRVLASRALSAAETGAGIVRLSTQREFVCENLGNLDAPGDETAPRRPGYMVGTASGFISESQGGFVKAWGHKIDQRGTYPATWMDADDANANGACGGLALQTYPEPVVSSGGALAISPADYDGNLQLATLETPTDAWYSVATATKDMKMLARFDSGFDLDVADAYPANPSGRQCRTDVYQVSGPLLNNSLLDPTYPNTLYPDGAFCEKGRTPAFYDKDNAHGLRGLMSFWVKGNYLSIGDRPSHPFAMRSNNAEYPSSGGLSPNQLFAVANRSHYGPYGFSLLFETGHGTADVDNEHEYCAGMYYHHLWTLVTVGWQLTGPDKDDAGEMVVDDYGQTLGVTTGGGRTSNDSYTGNGGNASASAADLTVDDVRPGGGTGAHLLSLGALAGHDDEATLIKANINQGANATIDEFAIYDFGDGVGAASGPASLLAMNRWREGRYYRGGNYLANEYAAAWAPGVANEAGSYLTAPIALPAGAVLRKVAWTWYRNDNYDYAEIELVNPAISAYLWGNQTLARSTKAAGWTKDRQDWDLDRVPPGAFRVRVLFERRFSHTKPVTDSPIFDDLTLIYSPPGGARLSAWGDGG